jgi:hypothetical protein
MIFFPSYDLLVGIHISQLLTKKQEKAMNVNYSQYIAFHTKFYINAGLHSKMFHVKRALRSWGMVGLNLVLEFLRST